jgi:uncharacterized membrane-anchored protein
MMKQQLSVFGAAISLLAAAVFLVFWSLIAYGVYVVALELGFHQRPGPPSVYWMAVVGLVLACIFYQLHKIANRP